LHIDPKNPSSDLYVNLKIIFKINPVSIAKVEYLNCLPIVLMESLEYHFLIASSENQMQILPIFIKPFS